MPTRTALAGTSACALIAAAVLAQPARAEIVKAPTGEKSRLHVSKATQKRLKHTKTKLVAITPAKKSGATLSLPYDLARWDFSTHDGDVSHFAKQTGLRFKFKKRSVAMTHPRLTMDTSRAGYITALISNVRLKVFTVNARRVKIGDTATTQTITGYKLKLTQGGADYVNRALRHKALKRYSQFGTLDLHLLKPSAGSAGATVTAAPGFLSTLPGGSTIAPTGEPGTSVDADGDGTPDASASSVPISGGSFDVNTNSGQGTLDGALAINIPALGTSLTLDHPQVVIGATPNASGLFADVNSVRLKVGDIDTDNLNLDIGEGTVQIHGLNVTVSGALAPVLNGILGQPLVQAGTPLLSLDLTLPKL